MLSLHELSILYIKKRCFDHFVKKNLKKKIIMPILANL